jgi:MSHA biogenesis protein MshI
LALFNSMPNHGPRVGIALMERAAAVAVLRRRVGQRPQLEHCLVHASTGDESLDQTLRRAGTKANLARAKVFAVANSADYQLLQVEAPEVPAAELRAAMRWRLRDVIDFHIDDAVIDVFPIPDQSRRAQGKLLFAVAARSQAVQRMVSTLAPVARHFDVIDIPELCLRNVAALLPQDQRGVAVLLLGQQFAQLILTRQGVLYLARRIDYARGFAGEPSAGLDAGALALELQRSLDYFESHYDQGPIGDLLLAPGDAACRDLAARLQGETNLRVELLSLRGLVDGELPDELSAECLLAIGAALRAENMDV